MPPGVGEPAADPDAVERGDWAALHGLSEFSAQSASSAEPGSADEQHQHHVHLRAVDELTQTSRGEPTTAGSQRRYSHR